MNKKILKLTAILIIIGLIINLIPFYIKADTSNGTYIIQDFDAVEIHTTADDTPNTYYGLNVWDIFQVSTSYQQGRINAVLGNASTNYLQLNSRPHRFTTFINTYNGAKQLVMGWVVKRENGSYYNNAPAIRWNKSSSGYYSGSVGNLAYNGETYDYYYNHLAFEDIGYINPSWNISGYTRTNNENIYNVLLRYTFGEDSIDPQDPPIEYGELIISYRQNIYTEHPENNLDMISWNAYMDTAGNSLQNKKIEIQAYAGYFEGSSYADLKQTRFSDWLASTHPAVTMYKGDIEISHQEYNWGDVASNFRSINTLGTWFWNIFTTENTWYQYGWRYRARLLDENEEPLTAWQIIYTGNAYSPSATETLTDEEPLTPDDVETINDINDENGNVINWYINNTVINNNEYNETYQQNIIQNIYNILQGTPDDELNHKAEDVQQTIDNAIDTEDDYLNDLQTQLNDLELNDITQNNGLMKALRWVREVHHETIENTELAGVVLTIMLIGLITYLIGRRNG